MNQPDLAGRLEFIRAAEQLKNVLRSAYTSTGRQESTPEHTWRLCLLAMVFQDRLAELDFEKVLKICVIHDLGEAINGDVPAIHQSTTIDKSVSERRDLLTLLSPLPAALQQEFVSLWDEYDNATSAEAQAVKALDKLETIIQHSQGKNPPDFDYAFNLSYGQSHTSTHALFAELRALVDEHTRQRLQQQQRHPPAQ